MRRLSRSCSRRACFRSRSATAPRSPRAARISSTRTTSTPKRVQAGFVVRITALPGRILITADDVTEDRRERADLERFAALVENGRSLVAFVTPDFSRFYVNPAGRRLTGIPDEDPHLFLSRLPDAFRRQLREQIIPDLVVRGYWSGETTDPSSPDRPGHGDGAQLLCRPRSVQGRLLSHAAIARDITAVKCASENLLRYAKRRKPPNSGSSGRRPNSRSRQKS